MSAPAASRSRRGFLALAAAWVAGLGLGGRVRPALAQTVNTDDTPFIGELRLFAGSVPPSGWMFCQGQILPISENESLYYVIGTQYGGDGTSTFALPDLRGRAPIHTAPGYPVGQLGGEEAITLLVSQMPAHAHIATASSALGSSADPAGGIPARNAAGIPNYTASGAVALSPAALTMAGGSAPHTNMQPWLGVQYMISLFGIFPSP